MASTPIDPSEPSEPPDFRLLFESLPGAFLVLDRELRIRAASDAYVAATLTVRSEIVGRPLFEVFPDNPDDPASESGRNMRASLTRVLDLGVTDVMPLARHDVRRPPPETGFEEKYWSPTNSPVLDGDGAVAYVIHRVEEVTEFVKLREGRDQDSTPGTTTRAEADILGRRTEVATLHTQLIEASTQAREREETLQAFIDFAPAVVTVRDRTGRLLLSNRRFEARFQRPADSEGSPRQDSVMTAELAARMEEIERQVFETGAAVSAEADVPGVDGTTRVYEFTKFPLRSLAGEVHAVGTIATDVTAARADHAALAASEELFRQMAENVDEVFLLWEEGSLATLYVSPALQRIIGLDAGEYQDQAARLAIVHPDDRDRISSSRAPVNEFRIIRHDGEVRWIRSRTSVVETPEGRPDRGVTTLSDVTEAKLAELAAHAARTDAEAANRAKSEFLSLMSHELRTPLNAILGFGQLLEMGDLKAEQGAELAQIIGAGRHLLGLIDTVLDIARAETGDLHLSLEPVSLRDVTDEAVGMIRPLADRRLLQVVVDAIEPDVHVVADRQRLKQVLLNLLANAVKYNREGGSIRVEHTGLSGPERFRLTVSDTGLGIAEGALELMFQPFERLSAERSEVEGSGLGLALARHLVTAMSGQIGVTSRVGEGSSFWIELPSGATPSARPDRSSRLVDRPPPPPVEARTLLYIEDNPSNVRLVERLVARRPGVELVVALQGTQGLELARAHSPDLILLDLHLPDMRGTDVLRVLRAERGTATTPIVVLSADASPARPAQLLAAGATDYITKPFDVRRLLAVIDAMTAGPDPT